MRLVAFDEQHERLKRANLLSANYFWRLANYFYFN